MDVDERHTAEPFGLGHETIDRIPCDTSFCDRYTDDYDPIIIDEKYFCDHCASDLISLRFDGAIEGVALKTEKLKRCIIN